MNWADYETATRAAAQVDHIEGVGFVLNTDGPVVGVDLDDCRDPDTGAIEPWAREIIDRLDSFTEISPSETGLHIYVSADDGLPGDNNRSGNGVEMYDGSRFFTVTGNRLEGAPKGVTTAQSELEAIYNEHIATDDTAPSEPPQQGNATPNESSTGTLEDQELIEKAKNADGTGPKFRRVWNGDYSHQPSHSEARLELYNYLAYWTVGDEQQMWRLFQRSGLYPHPTDPGKCGRLKEGEIQKAIRDTQNTYDSGYYTHHDKLPDDERAVATADGGRLIVSDQTVVRVVEALEELGEASTSEIKAHDAVDRSKRHVRRAIKSLEEENVLESQRDGRSRSYSLLN